MDDLAELLVRSPIFALLGEEARAEVAAQSLLRKYLKGEVVALYGDVWPYLFLVSAGSIRGVKESPEGRRLIVITLQPGDLFWGLAFFNPEAQMPVTLEAAEDSQMYLWSRQALSPLLLENGPALWELCRLMINRMQQASQIVEGLAFQPVAGRLARLILDRFGGSTEPSVARDLTLDEMAARIGSTREMVCRLLYRFADEKLIQVTRTEFVLTDPTGLARLADLG